MRTLIAIGAGIAIGFLLFQWHAPPAPAALTEGGGRQGALGDRAELRAPAGGTPSVSADAAALTEGDHRYTARAGTTDGDEPTGTVTRSSSPSVSADIIPRWLICHTVDDCHNPPPKPIRSMLPNCDWSNDGLVQHEWDQRLGTFVPWECKCYTHVDGCHWIRRPLQHRASLPWWPAHRRWVKDARRACRSIVCKTVWVRVRYPTRNIGW